jgi:hypothetical protein
VQPRPDPWRQLILARLEHASCRLDLGPDAPLRDEGARERCITEVEGVIPRPGRRHGPRVRSAVLVEPAGYLNMPLAETCWQPGKRADTLKLLPFDRDQLELWTVPGAQPRELSRAQGRAWTMSTAYEEIAAAILMPIMHNNWYPDRPWKAVAAV